MNPQHPWYYYPISFSEQVDRLLAQLKVDLLRHHEQHCPAPPGPVGPVGPASPTSPAPPAPVVTARQLQELSDGPGLMGQVLTDSESDDELQSPTQVKDLAVKPKSEPKIFAAPSSVPPPLVTAEGLQRSGSSAILAASGNAGSAESESPQRRRSLGSKVFGKPSSQTNLPSKSDTSSEGFGSSDDEEVAPQKAPRRTGSAIPEFFKASVATESRFRAFVEDPDSSNFAFYFAQLQYCFLLITSGTIIWQASRVPGTPMLPNSLHVNIVHCVCEGLLFFDCVARWSVSYSCKSYIQNPYNIIDLLAVLPLPLRITLGVPLPSMEDNLVVHVLLVGFVPFIRLLKMVRRFHKIEILLHVLSTTIDALKLLLFMVSIIVLAFSIVLYVVDDPLEIDSLSTAIYMCIVTVTTVGYGDITPKSWPAKVVSGCLCFISVLFMAMPLSVVGNAMSETWSDRHRILLVTRARRRLKTWGVSADDLPNIFKKFDADGNGELGMDEFIDFISRMKVGIKPSEASDLFLAFDTDGSGGIDEKEFMKTLFPVDYRRIYRRASTAA